MNFPRLSPRGEFVLVLVICFGWLLLPNVVGAWYRTVGAPVPPTWWARGVPLRWLGWFELLALAAVFGIGQARGWSWADLGLRRSRWAWVAAVVFSGAAVAGFSFKTLPLTLVFVSAVNPFFEELMEMGYVAFRLERQGKWAAIGVSAVLRGVLHLHFGYLPALGIAAFSVAWMLWYWRKRELWRFILLHALGDLGFMFATFGRPV